MRIALKLLCTSLLTVVAAHAEVKCPLGIEEGSQTFRFGEYADDGSTLWKTNFKYPFYDERVPVRERMSKLVQNGLSSDLRRRGADALSVKSRVEHVTEATFLSDGLGGDLSEILGMIKKVFRAKCCPISEMHVGIGIRQMPHPRDKNIKRPRAVMLAVVGCPPTGSPDHSNEKIKDAILDGCSLSFVKAGQEFTSGQIKSLLVSCSVRISTTAPIQTEEKLKQAGLLP